MSDISFSEKKEECQWCGKSPSAKFCPKCGRISARVSDPILSKDRISPALRRAEIPENGTFAIRFEHIEGGVVNIECDISQACNISIYGQEPGTQKCLIQASSNIGACFEFSVRDDASQPSGFITFTLDNDSRDVSRIWKKKNSKSIRFPLSGKVSVSSEKWIPGSSKMIFPHGVRSQNIVVYNDSSIERSFSFEAPKGFTAEYSENPDVSSIPVKGYGSAVIRLSEIRGASQSETTATSWQLTDKDEISFIRIPARKERPAKELAISIDFGTEGIRLRARWPKGDPIFGKRKFSVEKIGEGYIPCQMVLDINGREFYFGKKAEEIISKTPMRTGALLKEPNLAAVTSLKNDIISGRETYTAYNPEWTNEYLLRLIFSRVWEYIRKWGEELFRSRNMSIPGGFRMNEFFDSPEYIFTYPSLSSPEAEYEYRKYLMSAFISSVPSDDRVSPEQLTFISESQAVINYCSAYKRSLLSEIPGGSTVCIINSGAGRTTVSTGILTKDKGYACFDQTSSADFSLNDNLRAGCGIQGNEFGGNALNSVLASFLGRELGKIIESVPAGISSSLWDCLWGSASQYRKDDKERYAKKIREKLSSDGKVTLKIIPAGGTETILNVDALKYSDQILKPIYRDMASRACGIIATGGTDLSEISAVILTGGLNSCRYCRKHASEALRQAYPRLNESFEPEERLNAVCEGAVLGREVLFDRSPVSLKIQDSSGEIDEYLIKENEAFRTLTIRRNAEFESNGIAVLNLIAESEELGSSDIIATAICRQDLASRNEYGDTATFRIDLSQEACVCESFSGSIKSAGWSIALSN